MAEVQLVPLPGANTQTRMGANLALIHIRGCKPKAGKGQLSMLTDKLMINTEVSGVGKALGITSRTC